MFKTKARYFTLLAVALIALSLIVAGCGQQTATNVIKVGATPKPHAEILEIVKPLLAKEGVELKIQTFTDYNTPNLAVDKGEIDANFFQHGPYLEEFNKDHNLKLVSIAKVHIEPMGIYSKKVKSLNVLNNGDTVAIPNDTTNGGRALTLLEKAGLIQLKPGVGIKATVQDIVSNPKNLKVTTLAAEQLPRVLSDPQVAAAVINGNYALEAGLNPTKDPLFLEEKDSPFANILVVKDTRANDPNLQKLAKALNSPEVKKFIEDTYKGAVIPAF